MPIIATLLLGAAGAALLWGFYRSLETRWPDHYISLNETFALRVSQTWIRVVSFRAIPVFIVGVGVGVTTNRLGGWAWVAIALATALHAAQSNVRAFIESVRGRDSRDNFVINHGAYHLVAIGITLTSGAAAIFCYRVLGFLVPKPVALLENLWIAGFVTVVGGLALGLIGQPPSSRRSDGVSYLIWRGRRDIGIDLLDAAFETAVSDGTDPVLLQSIMIVEALQRPAWVRRIERVKGKFLPRGSYGVTQEYADHPLSDEEALRHTSSALSQWGLVSSDIGMHIDHGAIWLAASAHNPELRFIQSVQNVYGQLFYQDASGLYSDHDDYSRVVSVRRYPDRIGLRIVSMAERLLLATPGGEPLVDTSRPPGGHTYWAAELVVRPTDSTPVLYSFIDDRRMVKSQLVIALQVEEFGS
ncbi:MAG TPA: hypothetical protein VGC45_11290 [Gryllotalpicola sp.]